MKRLVSIILIMMCSLFVVGCYQDLEKNSLDEYILHISHNKIGYSSVEIDHPDYFLPSLTFIQVENHIELVDAIEKKFKEISNRQASFQNMSIDERLAEIANLIENMLKKNGKFLSLDYSKICFDYIRLKE